MPWPRIVGMRNRIVHGYFDVDQEQVWTAATVQVPEFADQARAILEELA